METGNESVMAKKTTSAGRGLRLGAYFVVFGGLAACSQNYQEAPADQATSKKGLQAVAQQGGQGNQTQSGYGAGSGEPAGPERRMGAIAARVPAGWVEEEPASSMRLAQFRLTGDGAADAVLAVFHFGSGQGGSVDANIDRWYGQFSQPDGGDTKARSRRWQRQVGSIAVELVEIKGTFSPGMGMGSQDGPQPDYAMLGAIAQAPSGLYFVKLTGPAATVARWGDSFDAYIGSLKAG